jgi:hypothetical protein
VNLYPLIKELFKGPTKAIWKPQGDQTQLKWNMAVSTETNFLAW